MKASEVIEQVFNYLKVSLINMGNDSIASKTIVSVCDMNDGDVLSSPMVCVLPIRDAVAGLYVRQDRISVELQIVCYTNTFYELSSQGKLDDIVRNLMIVYPENSPPSNFHLVRRQLSIWIERLQVFQSRQIYQFHIID